MIYFQKSAFCYRRDVGTHGNDLPVWYKTKQNKLKPSMRLQVKTKQTKRSFEALLIKLYGVENLEARVTYEENIKLTLYYDTANPTIRQMGDERFEFPNHIGTWQKAGAWYNEPKKEDKA